MRKDINQLVVLLACLLGLVSSSVAESSEAERRPAKEKWTEMQLQAIVVDIDHESREFILGGPRGNLVTLRAGPEIKRFDEIEVGELVSAVYTTMTRAEFRDPTDEELKNPLVILDDERRSGDDADLEAVAGRLIRAVVWIKQVSLPTSSVTIKGPRGKYLTLPVEDQALLHELKVGERVVLTYAEAIAASLDKIEKPVER
jgi:hypothetical protein